LCPSFRRAVLARTPRAAEALEKIDDPRAVESLARAREKARLRCGAIDPYIYID
jgi:hypothetical protein